MQIKYPDIVKADVLIMTKNPPIDVFIRTNGVIEKIFIEDGGSVAKNEILAIIKNPASYKDVVSLQSDLKIISQNIKYQTKYISLENRNLEALEESYGNLRSNYSKLEDIRRNNYSYQLMNTIDGQIERLEALVKNMEKQAIRHKIALDSRKNRLEKIKNIIESGSITPVQFEEMESSYNELYREYDSHKNQTQLSRIEISELLQEKLIIKFETNRESIDLLNDIVSSIANIESEILEWEETYVLKSPSAGEVSFSNVWKAGEYVAEGSIPLTVFPSRSKEYLVLAKMPVLNSGKVKLGQQGLIKLKNYPRNLFGALECEIVAISKIPQDGLYLLKLRLKNNMITTSGTSLPFKQNMQGEVDIITEDTNLLERMIEPISRIQFN